MLLSKAMRTPAPAPLLCARLVPPEASFQDVQLGLGKTGKSLARGSSLAKNISSTADGDRSGEGGAVDRSSATRGGAGGGRPARAQNTEGAESGLELVNSEEGKCRAARGRSAEEEGTEVQRELWGEGSRARRGREGGGSGVGEGPPRVGHGGEGEGEGGGEAGERDSNFKEGRGGGTFTTKLGRTRARWGRAGTGERAPAPPGRGARMRSRRSAWLRHGGRGRPTTARSSPSPSPPFSLSSSTRS